MGEQRPVLVLLLILCLFVSAFSVGVAFVSSDNWSEIARFTGSGNQQYYTDYFKCDHVEWRIRWEYVPDSEYPNSSVFSIFTYPQKDGVRGQTYINYVMEAGTEITNGTLNIHEYSGIFYIYIYVGSTESYTIIVEQDLNSIPEFPSWTIVPSILIVTLTVIVLKKRLTSKT